MKTITIIQPGRLGDLIICLPIAKHYKDLGYRVIWPVNNIYKDMMQHVVDYVEFKPVTNDVYRCILEAYSYVIDDYVDVAATFPGSKCTEEYVKLGDGFGPEKFDEFKYRKANVPFDKKWQLSYVRDIEKENDLYNLYVKQDKYIVIGLNHSKGRVNFDIQTDKQVIELNEKHNIFDWRKILENARYLVLVDSAMANLVEQLNIQSDKILIRKPGQPTPTFRNKWTYK